MFGVFLYWSLGGALLYAQSFSSARKSDTDTQSSTLYRPTNFHCRSTSATPLLPLGTPYPNASERDPRRCAMRKCPWMKYTCSGRSNWSLFSACFSHFAWTLSRCWAPRGWRRMATRCRYGSHAGRSRPTGAASPPSSLVSSPVPSAEKCNGDCV